MTTDQANQKKLRELAGLAYRRELAAELAKLEAKFARWRSGDIDPFELSDEIHRFHDGVSRELYNLYGNLPPNQSVPRAVALEILQEADVPPELLAALESTLQFFRDFNAEPARRDRSLEPPLRGSGN
jgi:hypothetical protein